MVRVSDSKHSGRGIEFHCGPFASNLEQVANLQVTCAFRCPHFLADLSCAQLTNTSCLYHVRTRTVTLGPRAFCSSGLASWNSRPVSRNGIAPLRLASGIEAANIVRKQKLVETRDITEWCQLKRTVKNTHAQSFCANFDKLWQIVIILSLLQRVMICWRSGSKICHLTLNMLPHYLAKPECLRVQLFINISQIINTSDDNFVFERQRHCRFSAENSAPPLFHPNFRGVPFELDCRCCSSARSEDPTLIIRVINFELVQPICSRYVNVTDGQTDRRTDGRHTIAIPRLHYVHRAVKSRGGAVLWNRLS